MTFKFETSGARRSVLRGAGGALGAGIAAKAQPARSTIWRGSCSSSKTATFITPIPYRGAGSALQDLIAGNADSVFDGLGASANHIKGGRTKALMVSGARRNPAFPDVPCAAELGLSGYTITTRYGMWVPNWSR